MYFYLILFFIFIVMMVDYSDTSNCFNDTQNGVSICTVNVNGFSSNHERGIEKRLTLSSWLKQNNIDICCGQEWYKFKKNENIAYNKGLSSEQFNPEYCVHFSNSKTFILYKSNIKFIKLNYNLKAEGLDVTWGLIDTKDFYLAIGSVYHSPSYEASWEGLSSHINNIQSTYHNKPIYFNINGDVNAKHQFWTDSTNDRGEQIVEFMDENKLSVHNIPGMKTHRNLKTGKYDAIDITMISDELKKYITEWYTNMDLVACIFNDQPFSDHFCVVIKFEFNIQLDNNIKYTWRFNKKRDNYYCKLIKNNMEEWFKYYLINRFDIDALDDLVEYFELLIRDAAIEAYGIKVYNKNNPKIFSKEERLLKRKYRNIEKKYTRIIKKYGKNSHKSKILKKQLNKINKQIKIIRIKNLNDEIESYEERINNSAIDNTKEFYRLYNKAAKSSNSSIGPLYDKINGDIIAISKEEIAEKLLIHYNKPLKENKYNKEALDNHKKVDNFMHNYVINDNQSERRYNKPFTNFEVMKLLNNLNLNSAMGYDMIHYKLLFIAKYEIVTYLTALYNLSFINHRRIPNCWRYSIITPIPKPGRKPIIEQNTRPVSVSPANIRNIEKLNSNRIITSIIEKKIALRTGNNAFQPNKGTDDNLIDITESIYRAMDNKSFIEMIFMDIKSAYDSVWIDGFIYKLINFNNIDGNIIAWHLDYLNERYNCVRFNGYQTNWILSRKCFPQGGPSMPTWWNLFVDDYKAIEFIININNFADDTSLFNEPNENMSIMIETNKKIEIRKAMQNEINNLYQWSLNWKLIISENKCKSITFTNKNKFNAYIYNVNGNKIDLIHHAHHTPPKCKHNKITNYHAWNYNLNEELGYLSEDSNLSDNVENYQIVNNSYTKINRSNIKRYEYNLKRNNMTNMELSERFLGLYFDPKLTWKEHLKKTTDKINIKLHQLRKIAYSDTYNLSTHAVWRLYISVIRPILEYGLVVYGNDKIINELEKLQYKAARIALRMKKTTPRRILRELLNITTIKERNEILQIKLWNRYSRAPNNYLSGKIFNKWKNYLIKNSQYERNYNLRSNKTKDIIDNNININKFNHITKSPLTRAYMTIKRLKGDNTINIKRIKSVNKSPPCYQEDFPNNIYSFESNVNPIDDSFIFYTDGSMIKNPGPGGCAYWSPNFPIDTKMKSIMHDSTINYAELMAFKLIFKTILYFYKKYKTLQKNIVIYSDSLYCINLFSIDGYTKINYYYILMNKILKLINEINVISNIKIQIMKVKSHTGIMGNEIVDGIAKHAAKIAEICKNERYEKEKEYPKLHYSTINNSISVDDQILIDKLNKYNNINNEKDWNNYFYKPNTKDKFIGEGNFIHGFPKNKANMPIYCKYTKYYCDEHKLLTPLESSYLNQLRSEHIGLNNYENFYFKNKHHHNGLCQNCGHIESVRHYILECDKFKKYRDKLFKNLRNINIKFKYQQKIKIKELLFPFTWQKDPDKNENVHYHLEIKNNISTRIGIYREIIKYIIKTKRFNHKLTKSDYPCANTVEMAISSDFAQG